MTEADRERCAALLQELAELRAFPVPAHDADGREVHEAIRELRARLDRAEVIRRDISVLVGRARREARGLGGTADEAYDTELGRLSQRAVTREYESIKDREVTARLKALEARKAARKAERAADIMAEAEKAADGMYFSLRDIREELLTTLRSYLPWLASVEA